ncbi:MAG: CDP-alcohol phosphatidyltransferase family protein [Thermoplasmatota archaeon]
MQGQLRERLRIGRLRTFLGPADILTLTNGLAGLLAIFALASGTSFVGQGTPLASLDAPYAAAIFIAIGLVADALDGTVARRFGGSQLGGDLDTLCDAITFVCTPAILVAKVYGTGAYPAFSATPLPFPALVAAGLLFIFGILRLARFNSNPVESETKTFTGLPTPWMAIVVTLIVLVHIPAALALPFSAILAFLMVSNLAYPKSRGQMVWLTGAIIVSGFLAVVIIALYPSNTGAILQAALGLLTLGIAIWPFFLGRARKRAAARAARSNAAPGDPPRGGLGGGATPPPEGGTLHDATRPVP